MKIEQYKKLVLVGFMGTGKSSVAKGLQDKLQLPIIDLDAEIVAREGRDISAIFASDGEFAFRDIEESVLKDVLTRKSQAIIATGGGAVLRDTNKSIMLEHGLIIALKAEPDVIIQRVMHDSTRPLLQGDVSKRVHDLLEQRRHAYDFAHYSIDTTKRTLDQVVDEIMNVWKSTK